MVGHGFGLRVKHRVEDKMLNPGRSGSFDGGLTNNNLIRVNIRWNMVDSLNSTVGSYHIWQRTHISKNDFLGTEFCYHFELFRSIYQGAYINALFCKCSDDCFSCFTSCSSDEDHKLAYLA